MKEGSLLNWIINKLPCEVHLPGYNYCGPGTKLHKRLARGDRGINRLDEYCKQHDIAYNKSSLLSDRHKADIILMKMAKARATASDANFGERVAANLVHKAMLTKIATGSGLKTNYKKINKSKVSGRGLKKNFKNIMTHTKRVIRKLKPKSKKMAIELAMAAARELTSDVPVKLPRVIPVPKSGGFLPLIPIFAGLSAAGSLTGGAAGIAKVINDCKAAKKRLEELKRHNEKMEALSIGKGLHLKPHKDGLGIYIAGTKN